MASLWRLFPPWIFHPLRMVVVGLPRGSLPRSAAVAVLKSVARGYRTALADRLSSIRPLDRPDLSFASVDSMVMDAIYWFGVQGYEGKVADVWIDACRRSQSVLEIGGNVGLFTVIGGKVATGSYTVVEPVPSIAGVLRRNLATNNLPRVDVLEAAVIAGPTEETVHLSIPDEGRSAPVGAFLAGASEVTDRGPAQNIPVRGIPFRDLLRGRDLVKIDAEGLEFALLSAARDILIVERPTLLIEVLPESIQLGTMLAELARDAGYEILIIPEWGTADALRVDPDQFTSSLPKLHRSKDVLLSPIAR